MTKTDRLPRRLIAALLFAALAAAAGGCIGGQVEPFAEPGDIRESVDVLRESPTGPIIVSFASFPIKPESPPDGVRGAVIRAIGMNRLSAACFFWSERDLAMRWIREQMDARRKHGEPPRLILAGHGLGATEACETARELLFHDRNFEIVLLLTVDAVKASKYGSAAYVAGNAVVNRLPGVSHSFTAYDAAPAPDGKRVLAHINYFQDKSVNFHGASMPKAENHRIADWTGLLNHGNADDFAMPFLVVDLKHAIARSQRGPGR